MADIDFNVYITDEGAQKARAASGTIGWYLTPEIYGVSNTSYTDPQAIKLMTLDNVRPDETWEENVWNNGPYSGVNILNTNELKVSIVIPPTEDNEIINSIYFVFKNSETNESFLFAVATTAEPYSHVKTASENFLFSFSLNNVDVANTYTIDYLYPQEIEDHNTSETSHPDIRFKIKYWD